jgi:hypothetical protein
MFQAGAGGSSRRQVAGNINAKGTTQLKKPLTVVSAKTIQPEQYHSTTEPLPVVSVGLWAMDILGLQRSRTLGISGVEPNGDSGVEPNGN